MPSVFLYALKKAISKRSASRCAKFNFKLREKRYFSGGFPKDDYKRALNTLRYIHANPKAASMQQGFFYDFSNYGMHDRLTDDGITQWHRRFSCFG